jgi:hypothetical protein
MRRVKGAFATVPLASYNRVGYHRRHFYPGKTSKRVRRRRESGGIDGNVTAHFYSALLPLLLLLPLAACAVLFKLYIRLRNKNIRRARIDA